MYVWQMDPAVVSSIVTGTVAIVAGLGGSALTTYFNRKNTTDTLAATRKTNEEQWVRAQQQAHAAWLRDRKQEAYAEFLAEAEKLSIALTAKPTVTIDPPVTTNELSVRRGTVKLVGSPAVRSLARKVEGSLNVSIHNQDILVYSFKGIEGDESEQDKKNRSDYMEAYRVAVRRTASLTAELVKAMREDLVTNTKDDEHSGDEDYSYMMYPLFPEEIYKSPWPAGHDPVR